MKVLHIITKRDALAEKIIEAQRTECAMEVEDLSGANVDYASLLEKIFTADSLQVW
jgi:hypothetical protein